MPATPAAPMNRPRSATESRIPAARFFLVMSVISCVIVFLGFAPSFYLKSVIHAPPPLTFLTIVHGVVFTTWSLLFVTQAFLIASNNPAWHRQLGILGVLLFGMVAMLGYTTAITAAKLGHIPPGAPPPLAFMALPVLGISAALILVILAVWNRRRSDWHMRLMLAAMFTMTAPATHRLAIPTGAAAQGTWIALIVVELLMVAVIAYDLRSSKRIHPASWIAIGVIGATHLGVAWGYSSPAWRDLAATITRG